MSKAGNCGQKDYGKPRCLARLTDQEHQAILSAVKKSGLSVRKWLLAKAGEYNQALSKPSPKKSRSNQ
jgi:hypothetical protein